MWLRNHRMAVLAEAARLAIIQWRFTPPVKDGKSIAIRIMTLTRASALERPDCPQRVASRHLPMSAIGQLPPFTRKKTRVRNDRSQGGADVARRRSRSEEIYKAAAKKNWDPGQTESQSNVRGLRNRSGAIDPLLPARSTGSGPSLTSPSDQLRTCGEFAESGRFPCRAATSARWPCRTALRMHHTGWVLATS